MTLRCLFCCDTMWTERAETLSVALRHPKPAKNSSTSEAKRRKREARSSSLKVFNTFHKRLLSQRLFAQMERQYARTATCLPRRDSLKRSPRRTKSFYLLLKPVRPLILVLCQHLFFFFTPLTDGTSSAVLLMSTVSAPGISRGCCSSANAALADDEKDF